MTSFEGFLAHRYLNATGRGSFIKLMRQLATGGIALGVTAMLLCMALMNGFHDEIQTNIFSATAHFAVAPRIGDIQDLHANGKGTAARSRSRSTPRTLDH